MRPLLVMKFSRTFRTRSLQKTCQQVANKTEHDTDDGAKMPLSEVARDKKKINETVRITSAADTVTSQTVTPYLVVDHMFISYISFSLIRKKLSTHDQLWSSVKVE